MGIEDDISQIRMAIQAGRFTSEAAVSQGIVLRLLHALSWPAYDTSVVWPEYTLGTDRRVDFALCHPAGKPIALVEVKKIGQTDKAERQLFEYAFHQGVPMAILTDGKEWNFFLPAEQGDYGERRVYKLDIVERDVAECAARLHRYLHYADVASGRAIQNARDDYANVSKDRQVRATLPKAWNQLIDDEDEMLLEILAERTESLCGFKPGLDAVALFLKSQRPAGALEPSVERARPRPATAPAVPAAAPPQIRGSDNAVPSVNNGRQVGHIGFTMGGQFHPAKTKIDVLRRVLEALTERDPSFPRHYAAMPQGRKRRYLAIAREELYPNRPDLSQEYSIQLSSGLWMSTNHSSQSITHIVEQACDAAKLTFGKDVVIHLE